MVLLVAWIGNPKDWLLWPSNKQVWCSLIFSFPRIKQYISKRWNWICRLHVLFGQRTSWGFLATLWVLPGSSKKTAIQLYHHWPMAWPPAPQVIVDMDHTTTHKQKWLFFLKASTDPKTINIDIGGMGVVRLKVKTYDEMAVFFEEPGMACHLHMCQWLVRLFCTVELSK